MAVLSYSRKSAQNNYFAKPSGKLPSYKISSASTTSIHPSFWTVGKAQSNAGRVAYAVTERTDARPLWSSSINHCATVSPQLRYIQNIFKRKETEPMSQRQVRLYFGTREYMVLKTPFHCKIIVVCEKYKRNRTEKWQKHQKNPRLQSYKTQMTLDRESPEMRNRWNEWTRLMTVTWLTAPRRKEAPPFFLCHALSCY